MACFLPQERQSFSNFLRMGYVDSFRHLHPDSIKYTFFDIRDKSRKENKGWRLDYILCSKYLQENILEADIHPDFWGSDHVPVSMTVDVSDIDLADFQE